MVDVARAHLAAGGTLAGMPHRYVTCDGVRLGTWVSIQRSQLRHGTVPASRAKVLDELGITAERSGRYATQDDWLREVAAYLAREGHLDVPQTYVSPSGARLGVRVSGWRRRCGEGRLDRDLEVTLRTLGMDLGETRDAVKRTASGVSRLAAYREYRESLETDVRAAYDALVEAEGVRGVIAKIGRVSGLSRQWIHKILDKE
jgi:hypothetical protein